MSALISRRSFLKLSLVAGGSAAVGLAGCASGASSSASAGPASAASASAAGSSAEATDAAASNAASSASSETAAQGASNKLVLIFSRADENYVVGTVDVGNTMVLAQFIQQKTGADLFELEPVVPYAADYQTCIDYALEEQKNDARPKLKGLPDLAQYDTVYFGFPVWWGDIPMPVYTAIEALDWHGKTIAPFNTHEGSGDAGMFETLKRVCAGATVLDGLTMEGHVAQQDRERAESGVDEWLAGLGI